MPFWSFLSERMANFFSSIFKGRNGSESSHGSTKEAGFQKAMTGSKATLLVNDTKQTLYLRDKVGAAYGGTRYKISGKSSIEVSPLQHTFFKMLAYAVEEGNNVEGGGEEVRLSETAGSDGSKKKKTSTDTNLTIDSDQLADNKQITITHNGSEYKLQFFPR